MAERPLYTLYKNLKAQNYDVPDDYNKFESALTRDGKGGADNRHAIYENLKAQNFDVPSTYERFYSALFEPRSKTSSRAKGGSVPMSAADRARFSAGAAAISASAQQTMNNAGRYNRLKQRKQKQQKDFGRVNLGTHQTPYGGDANNVVKDNFAYNPETGKAGAYVTSDNENVYSLPEAEQMQAILDKQNDAYQVAVDTGEIPSAFDVRDKNGNYDLQENIGKNGTYLTEEGAQKQFDKKLADAYARKKEIEALIAEDNRQHGNPLLSYGASIGASNGRTAEQSDYRNKLATSLSLVTEQIGALEAVKQYPTSSWGEDALKALDNTVFTAKTWDFGLTDFATMGQMERIKTKMDNKIPLSGSDKMLLKSKLGADAAAALEDEKMGNIYRWTKIAGQSLPFMADFFLTGGYGGVTKGISRGALKFAAKRGMGKVSAAILKNTGIVAGDVIGSYAMAGTEQALKTGADIMQRHLGNLYQDEKGDYKFGTFDENGNLQHEGGESMGTALYKGLTSAMVENYTEKLFGHNYGIKKGAVNFMEKHGMNASAEFFKNIGKSGWYTNSKKWMEKFGINGFAEEVMEEEIGIPLHALLDGEGKVSDLLDTKQQLDIIGGMAISVGSMYAMGAGSRPVKGIYNRAQYYRFRNKVNVADSDAENLLGDNWADIKDKIDNATNEQMGSVLAGILRQRDTMTKEQINAAVNYGVNLMKMRGYNIAKTAEMNAREITNEPTTPEEQHQTDIDNAYSEGHDADDADKHDIQIQQEDQMKNLAAALGISEQQLSAMSDDELQSLTGQDDKLDQAIYDYQLSSARYQGVVDDAQDKVDLAAHQAEQRVDMYTDQSRGSVRNATIKASGGLEDYGVYIISGNVATHEDGSIDVSNSDDMILYYDPTKNSVEHADALMFAELGEELPADDVKAQAVADAKENAIKEVAGIIDGTVEVGSQFNVTDTDGTEHSYEVLADYGDGTAAISIDGNVVENPYSLADLQQMKDLEDQKRLEAAKAEREQMENERAAQQTQETEQTQPSFDFNQILNDNGNVVLVDVLDEDGNTKYPDSRLFLIRDTGAKAKVVELKSDGTIVPHAVNKEDVATISSMSLDEYKQAMPESSIIEDNSGEESDEDSQLANLGLPKGSEIWMSGDGFGRPKENTQSKVVGIDEQGSIILEDKDGKKWSASFDYINNHRELPPLDENANIVNEENNQSESNAEENTPAPEQTPAITLEDGTIVPMLEDGNPDFSKLTAEQTAELYDTQFGEDADSVISNWVSEAKKALDKANNMAVKGKTFVEQKAAKDAKEKAIADAQAAYDSAIAIRDAYNERQLAKVEDTAEGRKNLIDKARRKFARLKSAVKDDAEAVSQLYRDTIGSLLHRLYDGTVIDVTDTTPLTAEEYVASNLGAHSLNYEGTETSKGVKQETGLSIEDFAKTQLLAADGKGTTIDALVHSLWENRPSNLESLDTQDIRNALIGVLNSGFKASEARNFVENIRIAQAENILEEQKRAQENAAYAEQHKAEPEAELKAKSDEKAELKAKSEEKLDNESDNESNDLDNETDNEKTNDNINDNINVPEDATDEAPLGAQRDESDLPFSAKENGKQQTTAERAADVEKNKVDDMKVVDNIVGEKTRKAFERLAKMMGANIQWQYSDKLGNGWIQETTDADGNVHRTIFITLDSSITEGAQFIFGHEMTHQIKKLNPAAYNELTQLVLETYGSDAFDKAVDETMKRYSDAGFSGRARDYYAEEVVADSVGEMIRDLNLAHTLAMKMSHPLLAAIHEILQKIKLAFFGTEYSDVTKNIIRSIEQAYVKTANGQVTNSETGEDVSFSLRQKPEPKKKGVGYKVFVLKDGKLYPPMVANPDGAATPVGVWLDADAAPIAGESKTGRPQVKQGGKGTQGGSGKLAYRPGWHLGVVPYAIQFNRKDDEGNKTLFPKNFVFAEVEYAADVDYQEEARQEGINPSGKYQHSLAGLKHLPTDGYYMYRTNPNPETDPWVITGAMKVNRILTRAEQADLVSKAGREPQQIQEGDIVTDDVVNSINQEIADAPKFSLKTYHGTGANFDRFDTSHAYEGAGSETFGHGIYVTKSAKIGASYALKAKVKKIKTPKAFKAIKNGDNWFGRFIDNAVRSSFDKAKKETFNRMDELIKEDENIVNDETKPEWKKNAAQKELADFDKLKSLFEGLTEEDIPSLKRAKANRYEVEIPDDTGNNYLDWNKPMKKEQKKIVREGLEKLGVDVDRLVRNGYSLDKNFGDVYNGLLYYALNGTKFEERDSFVASSNFLSSLGFTGIKYYAGTIWGGAKKGDLNYVIFNEDDAKIVGNTKFSLKSKPIRFEAGKKLSDEEKKEVLSTLKDAYKVNGVPYHIEETAGGKEKRVYEPTADSYVVSDITNRPLRYYITLPDGRVAHPTEVYPNISDNEVKSSATKQGLLDEEVDQIVSAAIGNMKDIADNAKAIEVLTELQNLPHETHDVGYGMNNAQSYNYKTGIFTSDAAQAIDYVVRRMRRKEDVPTEIPAALKKAVADSYGMVDNLIGGMSTTKFSLKKVNDDFNQRLEELVKNPNQKDKILRLGRSSSFLKVGGITDAEIELDFDKFISKSGDKYKNNHPFAASDLINLPMALAEPIAVFNSTTANDHVVLTELQKDGKNFIVAVRAVEQHRKGGVVLEVNKITSLYPKEERGIVYWINNGRISNVDKEKALHFIEALQPHAGTTITDEELKSAANIINSFETTKGNGEKVDVEAPKTFDEFLNHPSLKFSIKNEEQRKAAEDAYEYASKLRPNKYAQYALVDMSNPSNSPQYYEKKVLADRWRRFYNKAVHNELDDVYKDAWGNYKLFDLDRPFADQVNEVKGDVPNEFNAPDVVANKNADNESGAEYHEYKQDEPSSITYKDRYKAFKQREANREKTAGLRKERNEVEDVYKSKSEERVEYNKQLMKEYMDEHGLSSENDIPYDVWDNLRSKSFEKYQDELDSLFNKYKDLDKQIKAVAEPRFSLKDDEYLKAVGDGDMEKAQKMVNEAAKSAGYSTGSSYQGTSAFNGAAPWGNGYFLTKEERKEAWDNGEFEGESTLSDYINDDIDGGNLEELTNAASYRAADPMRKEAIDNVRNAIQKKAKTITMYRSVPSDVKEGSFRNGDWVTPSRAYAVDNAKLHGWGDDYNIIEQKVPVDDVWFDGNDIAEWGYGREEDYINDTDFAYKNSKNNKKLLDAVTYDDNGNVIPLSQRFNEKNKDVRFSLKEEKTLAGVHNITEEKLRKALKLGGFANPSLAVIDTNKSGHNNFGEISFIAPSALLDKRTGKTGGTWITDAYTQRYPSVERQMSEKGSQKFEDWVDSLEYPSAAKAEIKRQTKDVLEDNGVPAWELMYLKEKGIDIKAYDSNVDYRWKEIINDHPTAEDILSSMQNDPELNEKVTSLAKHAIIYPTWEKVSLEVRRKMYKETGVKASPINPQVRKQTKEIFERDYKSTLLNKDGSPRKKDVKKVVKDIVKEHNDTKKYDFYLSKVKASNYVNKNGLYDDYIRWQENKLDEFGTKNRIFRGYTRDGSRKYVPETLENVSKAMREEADGQTNGSEYTSFGSFIAKLATRVDSTDEMRANKDKLSSNKDKEEFYEKWSEVYYDLAKFLYNDVFYGEQRLHDIVLQSDPKKYAKKEYGITLTPTFMKKLDALKNAVQTELKSAYFETKYNRPLRLNEFAAAVVPDNLGEDVRKGIENAGLPMYDYDPNKEGDRSRAFNEAINSSDNIRFSLRDMADGKENGAADMAEDLKSLNTPDEVDDAIKTAIDDMPSGWKMANKKMIHIAQALGENRKAEIAGEEPKFSLKDGTLIKAGTYFSGGGLVEEGLKGIIDPVVAVEYDEKISGVYRNNFGQHIVTADVRDVDPKELVKQIDGEVEYFHASPVCKNYSQAKSNHAEVELDKETAASTAEFINAIKPKVVTIENVKGYKDSEAMKIITDALDTNGYTWDADVYNAADYGGYTNRERLIVRAVRDGKLPAKPEKMAHKSGWYEAVADIIPTLTEKKNGVDPWMDIRLKADGIDWRNIDKPLYVMGSAYADGKVPHAFADELLPTLRTKSGDVIVMPDGKVYRAMGRVLARVSGVSDDYKMPFSENLSHTIIGNGIPTQLTEHVIAPLLQNTLRPTTPEDGNTKFSLRYDKFEHDMNQWKKDNNLPKDAQRPTIPQRNAGESAVDFLRRVDEYRKQMALWKTAPTYEQHLLSDDTALGEFNRELQRGSVLKRIAFQDSMLAIRKAQEAIMKEVGVDRLNMAEDAYTAENRSHGKGKNEFEEYNNEFLQPLRKAYHQMKKILGDSYDNVRIYMMAKHGLERDAQMAFKKSLEADYEDVAQRSAAYKAYKGDMNRIINDSDLEFGRVDFTTWRQRDNALRVKYSPSYMDYRYDKNGIAYDYSGLSALFDGSDFEEAAHKLVKDIESKYVAETHDLWDATNAATKKILRDGYKAGMMSKDTYQYVRDMYSHYIPLRGWDGTTADQVWDYIGGGKGAFNQTLKKAHGRTSIADDPIAYIENMAESGILLNNKNWVKQHLMLLAQNHPTSLLTLSKAWYVKSVDDNGNEEWIPATPQITSQMDSNQVKAAIDAFEKKMEKMAQTGDATQKRDGLNIAYPQTHSEEREHEVRVMKDGEEYVIYVNGDPQLAQAMNNTRAHRVREIQSGKLDRAAAWLGRKMAAAYTSLSPLFIPSNYFRDLTMTLASTAIREDGRYNYLLRKNMTTSWNLGFMLRDYQNGKLRDKVNNGNATPKEQMFYDFMMNGGETGFVSSLDVEDLKKKFKNDLKDLDRWKTNPVKVGHTIMDGIEFLNRAIEDSNRFAVYMTSIQYGRSIDEAVNDAKDVTLNFNRKGTGEYGWQMVRNLYLFINPAVQSLQTLGALVKHHPFKFTAVTASWLASGVLVPIVNAALMSMLGGDDDKDKYWQFTKWDRRNNLIMWVPFTHEYVKIPLAQEFRAFYGIGDMIASKMMGGELAEESWSQYAEDLLGQVVDMLPLDPTGYDGNIAVSLMPNAIRPVFELAFNVDFTGKPLFKETEYNKYDPNFTKAYVGTPDWLVRASRMVNSIGNDYPDVQQNSIDAFGDPKYNLNNPAVVDHVLSSYLGGAYTMGSQVLGVLTKSLNDPKEIKVADIPLVSKFVSNPDDRPVTKKQGDEFWNMKENYDRAANTLSKLKKQAKVDGDYSKLERFYGSEEYKQYKQDDMKVKKYEEDKKKERAEESGEEYRPHKLNAEDIYKAHATPKDDFEDLKLKQLYTKLNGFKTSYDLLVDTAPSQSDGYYNTNKAAIDAIDEISLDKQEISELKKGFLDDGKDAYNAEDMKQIRELRKKILAVLEKANKVVVANQKAKAEK